MCDLKQSQKITRALCKCTPVWFSFSLKRRLHRILCTGLFLYGICVGIVLENKKKCHGESQLSLYTTASLSIQGKSFKAVDLVMLKSQLFAQHLLYSGRTDLCLYWFPLLQRVGASSFSVLKCSHSTPLTLWV